MKKGQAAAKGDVREKSLDFMHGESRVVLAEVLRNEGYQLPNDAWHPSAMREYAKLQGVNFIPNGQIVSSQNAARRIQAAVRGFVVKTIIAKLKTTNSAAKEVKEAKRATKAAALAVVAARGKQAGGRDATGKHEGLGLLAEEGDSGAREGAGRADTKNGAEGPGSTPCTGRMSPSSIERGRLSRPISGHRPALHMKSCRIHIEGTPLQPTRTPTKRSLDPVATLEPTSALPLPTDMRPESSPLRAATRLAPPFLASPILVRHRPQEPSQQLPQPVPPAMNALTVSAGGARSRSPSRSLSPSAQRYEEEEEEEEDCGEGEKRSGGSPARSRSPSRTHRHQAPAHPKFVGFGGAGGCVGVDFLVSTSFGASPANVHTKSSPQHGAAATGTAAAGFESQPDPLLRYQQQQQQSNWRKQQMSAAASSLPAGGGEVLGGCGAVFGRALPPPRRPPPASPRRAFSALYPQQQKGQSKGRTAASSNKVRVEVAAGGSGGGSGGGDGGGSRDKGAHAAFRVLRSSGDHRHNPYHAGDADDHDDHNGDDDACRAALFTEPHERVEALRTAVVASCRPDEERVDTGGGVGVGDDADDEVGRVPGVQLEMTQSSRGHFPPPLSSDHVRSGAASHDVSSRPRAAAAAAAAAAVNGGGGGKQQQQRRIPARPSSAPSFGARARKTVPSTTLAPPSSSSASPSPRVGGTVSTTGFGIVDSYEASIGGGGGCGGSGSFAVKRLRERRALEASRRSEHATLLHLQFMEEQVGFTEGVQKAALDQKEQKQQRRQQRRRQRHQQERAEKKKKTLQQEEEAQQRPFPAPLAPTTLTQPPLASQRNSYTHASPLPTQSRVRQVPSTDSGCSGWSSGVSAVNSAPPTRRCYSAAQKKDKGHPLQGAKGSKSRNSAAGLPQG